MSSVVCWGSEARDLQHFLTSDVRVSPFLSQLYEGLGFPLALHSQNRFSSIDSAVSVMVWSQWGLAVN